MNDKLNEAVAELEGLMAGDVSPAPWVAPPDVSASGRVVYCGTQERPGYSAGLKVVCDAGAGRYENDPALIAAMRNALPGLLAALKAERERADRTQAWLDRFQGDAAAATVRAMQAEKRAERAEAALSDVVAKVGQLGAHAGSHWSGAAMVDHGHLDELEKACEAARPVLDRPAIANAPTIPPGADEDEQDAAWLLARGRGENPVHPNPERPGEYHRMEDDLRALPPVKGPPGFEAKVWAEIEKSGKEGE